MGNEINADKTIVWQPDKIIQEKTGRKLTVIIPTPRCIVDSHMHIENGACTPLPLLWDKNCLINGKTREQIDNASSKGIQSWIAGFVIGEGGKIQVMPTTAIGDRAVNDNVKTFGPKSFIGQTDLYKNSDFFSPMIVMPMDMEYAHIAGYDGQTIYQDDEMPWYYFKRNSGTHQEDKGEKILLPGENTLSFSHWYTQYKDTIAAVKNHPLKLIPMYHYEPRRWRKKAGSEPEKSRWLYGAWDYPFKELATSKQKGVFIGFKMYTPLGYQPLDPALKHLWEHSGKKSDCYYGKCEEEGIPILVHCSPGGMTTHEMLYYREYNKQYPLIFGRTPEEYHREKHGEPLPQSLPGNPVIAKFSADYEADYFYTYHVHPKAWRKVLEKFPKLKLCLAHFGGDEWQKGVTSDWITEILSLMEDYPHVYADFSCHDIKKNSEAFRHVLSYAKNSPVYKRLLFGTDWYMTLIAIGGKGYQKFCEEYWDLITDKDLWLRFTFINPFEFFGLNDEQKLKNLNDGIINIIADDENVDSIEDTREANYASLKRILKEYAKQKDKLGGQNGN